MKVVNNPALRSIFAIVLGLILVLWPGRHDQLSGHRDRRAVPGAGPDRDDRLSDAR